MRPLYDYINATGVNTIVTTIAIIIGLAGLIAGSGVFVERRRRKIDILEAIDTTIHSIRSRRQIKMAVLEDFPNHKRLVLRLLPCLLRKWKIEEATKQYEQWYRTISEAGEKNPMNIFGADWKSEVDITLGHLENLKKAIKTTF